MDQSGSFIINQNPQTLKTSRNRKLMEENIKTKQEGRAEAIKKQIEDEQMQREKFDQLLRQGNHFLYKIQSVFPFDFFPNTLSIDSEKVTIKYREFFFSSEIRSIYVKDITGVYVDTGPFFATMSITDQFMMVSDNTKVIIPYLKKNEAMKARRIIQGLLIVHKQNIDMAKIADEHLIEKLEELGKMQ